jgi:hypothetical protein
MQQRRKHVRVILTRRFNAKPFELSHSLEIVRVQ